MNTTTSKIRTFNPFYTSHLDILNQHYGDSNDSLTEVGILYEISESDNITPQKITEILNLDKGYLSRILKRFLKEDLITRIFSKEDKRAFNIKLSATGNELLTTLNAKSEKKDGGQNGKTEFYGKEMLVSSMQKVKNLLTENKIERDEIGYCHNIRSGDIG